MERVSLGIPNYGPWYIKPKEDKNFLQETVDLHSFIECVINNDEIDEFHGERKLEFINYGDTQLVFVVTIDNDKRYTLLVNQPATPYGTGRKEFENLGKLSKKHPNVIKPIWYASDRNHELYITPYSFQARCIGINSKDWGMWIPEPEYHFVNFDIYNKHIINSCMVAMLIKLYDAETQEGIIKLRLDGGDFMLEKGVEKDISYENVMHNMKLIAARDTLNIELDDYIELIRKELAPNHKGNNILLAKKLKAPFSEREIEEGIRIGLRLRIPKKKKIKYKEAII